MKTIHCDTWQEFRDYVDDERHVSPVYWRGQRDPDWPLASPFERKILAMYRGWKSGASQIYPYDGRYKLNGKKIWDVGFYQEMRDGYLERFKRAASGLRGPNPKDFDKDDDGCEKWWALGRHYGLVTPLLDWTEKPYIAAFFAIIEIFGNWSPKDINELQGKKVAIYRLTHNDFLVSDCLSIVTPTVDELGRMHGQRGLFTWLDSEEYFELQGFLDNTGRGNLLTKIVLSDQAVWTGYSDLQKHGIDYRLLFPDLSGAALAANAAGMIHF